MGTPSLPSMIPMAQYQQMQQQQQQAEQTLLMAADASRKISAGDVLDGRKSQPMADMGKQRSLSTPNTPQQVEAFSHYQNADGTMMLNPMVGLMCTEMIRLFGFPRPTFSFLVRAIYFKKYLCWHNCFLVYVMC